MRDLGAGSWERSFQASKWGASRGPRSGRKRSRMHANTYTKDPRQTRHVGHKIQGKNKQKHKNTKLITENHAKYAPNDRSSGIVLTNETH